MSEEFSTTLERHKLELPDISHRRSTSACATACGGRTTGFSSCGSAPSGATGYVVNLGVFALCVHAARDRLPRLGGARVRRLGDQQLLAEPPLDVRRQAGAIRWARASASSPSRCSRSGSRYLVLVGLVSGVGADEGLGAGDRDRRGNAAELRRAEALELPGVVAQAAPRARRLGRRLARLGASGRPQLRRPRADRDQRRRPRPIRTRRCWSPTRTSRRRATG